MIIYIAGKITGDPNYKRKFARAAEIIRNALDDGHGKLTIINPAEFPEGLTPRDYMRYSFASIDAADFVLFLPDWWESRGARLERAYIMYTGQSRKITKHIKGGKHDRVDWSDIRNTLADVREEIYSGFYANAEAYGAAKDTIGKVTRAFDDLKRGVK